MISAHREAAVLAALAMGAHGAWAAKCPTDVVFAPDSFWYASIPHAVPLHPDSATFVQEFLRKKKAYYGNVSLNTGEYDSPVDAVGPEVAGTDVKNWCCQNESFKDKDLAQQRQVVPVPRICHSGLRQRRRNDAYQQSSDTLRKFWRAHKTDSGWPAYWKGLLSKASRSEGVFLSLNSLGQHTDHS